ncbi:hypothetical protein A3D05_01965 [Candidatus Gottesmanbacteria bacterium RIFCSPHIGHO2_02_FULL_40_24]|uniref:Uncharacterized protein n=1 Tax=Candidatus Gottesmanbacteria bacterium RIFCSPHIGHO2_01_FULL_40_15 TaxID=1798376 RepID=A0A1F5Z4F6_9BACT|nr:MAG: hypothetical protein A2777_04285 [Candidatus Gottesmanbacteria bacterium RIFCSPHIGHO2_01_FULL_40_15]OGG18621.1 MAG: hypothetical protein A3D05_01965 [Candidatus Gottesmanbacteria bacterium RIFCSPHIGHO2_02_FULL_40_24]OGG31724.1 MAG: hypothetical protein A3I80_00630 [Candidatus Gottesmanbacteria bacterium RIFCSPLOWO2_02_FULL_40_10]
MAVRKNKKAVIENPESLDTPVKNLKKEHQHKSCCCITGKDSEDLLKSADFNPLQYKPRKSYVTGLITGLLAGFLLFILVPKIYNKSPFAGLNLSSTFNNNLSPTPPQTADTDQITKEVLPEKHNLGVSFGSTVKKLVEVGAIDKQKFLALYESRGGLPDEISLLLDNKSDQDIIVTNDNSQIILNLLWPLGIANKTKTLSQGPMGTKSEYDAGSFASTGGWTLGKEDGGSLFNRFPILLLTEKQETLVTKISQKIYRPCCGNSTFFPDCNHGAAMLGFIELAVSQNMPEEEIYKNALVLNSYWFPQTYVELAMYFKSKNGQDWNKVDPQVVLGADYSSGQGYSAINKQLQTEGLLPKVEGGGGCGV